MMKKVFVFTKTGNVLKALIRKRGTTMEQWVNGNLVLYIVYSDELHQYTYTIFDVVKGTVQTLLNKQTAKEVYYA